LSLMARNINNGRRSTSKQAATQSWKMNTPLRGRSRRELQVQHLVFTLCFGVVVAL
jgi:hypothetical protein